jgi:hypothetical protein
VPFCRNLVKPPKPSIFSQPTDSAGNINLKIWRVYPLQFASLEIEAKTSRRDRKSGSRLFYWSPMKKKSCNSCPRTPQPAPLVRGPLNAKAKGDLAEIAFLYKAASLGFGVAQPYGDKERYDFILDSGERFWRVQVRSTSYFEADRSGYTVNASHIGKGFKVKTYQADEIDFFAAYIVPLGIWYVVPVNQLASLRFLRLYPSGCKFGGCFEAFREAWHLMAPGADLPQPRTLRRVRSTNLHRERFVE